MDIESLSGAATVALASTLIFVLVSKSWHVLSRVIGGGPRFSDGIMREAAQRFRDEFEHLSHSQMLYLSSALVFTVLFFAAWVLDASRLFQGYPQWQLQILLVALVAGAVVVLQRLVRIAITRRKIRLRRDANIAIGHHLNQIASGFGRVYHDINTPSGVIDHVVLGQNGAFAINVFAENSGKNSVAVLAGNALHLGESKEHSIVPVAARNAALEREFRRLLDHRVRVRSVIAVPGWEVHEQTNEDHLLVNNRSLPMLRGWKDRNDYLMNEDVEALHDLLTQRCQINNDTKASQ